MLTIPDWDVTRDRGLSDNWNSLTLDQKEQIKFLGKKVLKFPKCFNRAKQEYEIRARMAILSGADIADRLIQCEPTNTPSRIGINGQRCGLRKLCDHCAYYTSRRKVETLSGLFEAKRVWALHISPNERFQLEPERIEDIRDEWKAQRKILSELRKACIFSKAVSFAEIGISFADKNANPHSHALVWDFDKEAFETMKKKYDTRYSFKVERLTKGHYNNMIRYPLKAVPVLDAYRKAALKAATPDEFRELNENVAAVINGIYHVFDHFRAIISFGTFVSRCIRDMDASVKAPKRARQKPKKKQPAPKTHTTTSSKKPVRGKRKWPHGIASVDEFYAQCEPKEQKYHGKDPFDVHESNEHSSFEELLSMLEECEC